MADLHQNPIRVDQHWQPQHRDCPFCLLNFTVYAKMEGLDQDRQKLNTIKTNAKQEKQFWSSIDNDLILQLEEPWAYSIDFQMFGYSLRGYFEELGLGHKI